MILLAPRRRKERLPNLSVAVVAPVEVVEDEAVVDDKLSSCASMYVIFPTNFNELRQLSTG
jgi:hypothetical protein